MQGRRIFLDGNSDRNVWKAVYSGCERPDCAGPVRDAGILFRIGRERNGRGGYVQDSAVLRPCCRAFFLMSLEVRERREGSGEWRRNASGRQRREEELSALEGMELDFSSVEELLGSRKQGEGRFSFEELLKAVFRGDMKEACSMAFHGISDSLFSELSPGPDRWRRFFSLH